MSMNRPPPSTQWNQGLCLFDDGLVFLRFWSLSVDRQWQYGLTQAVLTGRSHPPFSLIVNGYWSTFVPCFIYIKNTWEGLCLCCYLRKMRTFLSFIILFLYNVFQLPKRTPPPLCRLAGPAGWGFEYMLYYWPQQGMYSMAIVSNHRCSK